MLTTLMNYYHNRTSYTVHLHPFQHSHTHTLTYPHPHLHLHTQIHTQFLSNWSIFHGCSELGKTLHKFPRKTAGVCWSNTFHRFDAIHNAERTDRSNINFKINYLKHNIFSMKKHSERRKHCALAVVRQSQKFSPHRRPLPGGAGRTKFNQLEMVTTFTYRPSLVKIDASNFELSW